MKKLYTLKNLAWIGVTALVALLFWMTVACLIPSFHASGPDRQLYTIRHQDLRDNNPLYTNLLLNSIKENDGYLVLGTSESNPRNKGNYYDFLNADTSLSCRFSVIAGAGRTACTYFPLILGNDNVKNVKVLYYINPSYWCGKLATGNAFDSCRYIVILRTDHGQEDEHHVKDEERGKDDERRTHEVGMAKEEVVERDEGDERKVADIA